MDDVEQIKQKIDIASFIGEFVPLKKSGRNFKANCPFHSERTPSFYVSPERGSWHCFGCSKGGDVFSFLMEAEKIDFPDALRILAQKTGVKLTQSYQSSESQKQKERIYQIHHLLSEYFHYVLMNHPLGAKAKTYLEDRKINDKIIETFGLGYAPNAWDAQIKFLRKKGYRDEELLLAGVVVSGRRGVYDRFRGRLMFPIRDPRGQTIAFAGRVLDPTIKEAKYINSPETAIYVKGNTLYGLDVTKEEIKKKGEAIIVEGEFDMLSSFKVGIGNVVAIKGTALTEGQVNLLKRYTDKVIFALDQDLAGDQAARRGIEIADGAGLLMQVATLPSGKDPDECIKENEFLWKQAVEKTVGIYDYIISSAFKRFDPKTVEGKRRISDEVIPVLSKITNAIVLGHYIRELARELNVPEDTVMNALSRVKREKGEQKPVSVNRVSIGRQERMEETLIGMLFQLAERPLVERAFKEVEESDFSIPAFGKLFSFARENASNTLPLGSSLTDVPRELVSMFDRSLLVPVETMLDEETGMHVERLIRQIKTSALRRKIHDISTKIREKERTSTVEGEIDGLAEELARLTNDLTSFTEAKKV